MSLNALVEPADSLNRDEMIRYSRHVLIPEVGVVGQRRLKNARVLVVGAGGLGSPIILYLAAAGVGTIGIIDDDCVDLSNLQRQIIHSVGSVGEKKVLSAKKAIENLNPLVQVKIFAQRLIDLVQVENLLSEFDLVLDGSDNFATRYLLNDACAFAKKPYVWGSIFRFEGQVSVFWDAAPNELARNYRDLFPEPPPPELAPSCSEAGVFGVLCASIASIMATEAIKLITGLGEPLMGRIIVFDALEMRYREIYFSHAEPQKISSHSEDYKSYCPTESVHMDNKHSYQHINPQQLHERIKTSEYLKIIDVREINEWDIVHLPHSELMPRSAYLTHDIIQRYGKDAEYVILCKVGMRSAQVAQELVQLGARNVYNLDGGILAWARDVDPNLPIY